MSVLARVFRSRRVAPTPVECPHLALVPRWANAEDMGKKALVSGYFCTGCSQTFSAAEAQLYLG